MRLSFFALLLAVLPVNAQEKKEKPLTPVAEIKLDRKEPISYEKEIEPIFADKCLSCHAGSKPKGKLDLSTYANLMKGGKRGAALVAGKSGESILYRFSAHKDRPVMPPESDDDPLTPEQLALVKLWIDQGAKPPVSGGLVRPKVVVGLPPARVKPVRALAISPKGDLIASGRANQIYIYKPDGSPVQKLVDPEVKTADGKPANAAHLSLIDSMAWSPDGKTLATGSFKEVTLWDMEKNAVKTHIGGFADRVVALAYSPDGKYLAAGGGAATEDGELKLFDATGKLLVEIKPSHSDTVFGVCFSPDSTKLASGGADKFVKTWEVPSGKPIKTFEGHTHHVLDVGWAPDGKSLASAGADNVVKVWDYEKGEQSKSINAHTKQVTRLLFIGKTGNFVTTSGDFQVKMWRMDGNNIRNFPGNTDYVYAVAASGDGKLLVTGGEDGMVRIYNGENGQMVKEVVPPGVEAKK